MSNKARLIQAYGLRLLNTQDRINLLNNYDLGFLYVYTDNGFFKLTPNKQATGGLYNKSRVYSAIDANSKFVTTVNISVEPGFFKDTVDTWEIYTTRNFMPSSPSSNPSQYTAPAQPVLSLYTPPKPVYTAVRNLKAVNEWRISQGLGPLTEKEFLQGGSGRKSHRKHRNKKRRKTRHRVGQ